MDPTLSGILASVISAALCAIGGSWLTTYRVTAVMDQRLLDHARRILVLEDDKLDIAIHVADIKLLNLADAVNKEEIQRERHRMNNFEQRFK